MKNAIIASLEEAKKLLAELISDDSIILKIEKAAQTIISTFENGGRVFSCGNGGSMCDAMHFAEELSGRFRKDRKPYPAIAISDPGYISCVANDYGYDSIFSRYIEGHGTEKDCILAISTSGSSLSVVNAAKEASNLNMRVISLTGRMNSELEKLSDICICVPAGKYADRIQELHIKIIHILIELVEHRLHPKCKNKTINPV